MKKLILVSGLFASLVFIVNCDSTSTRSVKAATPVRKLDPSKLPPCSAEITTLATDRSKIVDDLKKKIEEAKKSDLTSEMKAALNTAIDNLRTKSNDLYKKIRALKGSPEGCNSVTSDNKKATYTIEALKFENSRLGKTVAELTGQSNILANSSAENDATTIIENQTYEFKPELARLMTKAKVDNMYLMDGKIFDGAGVADELKTLKEKKNKSFCYLEASLGELTGTDRVRVIQVTQEMNSDNKTASAHVRWVADGVQWNSFSCIILKTTDVPTEIRSIFGELIILKNGVGSAGDVNTGHL